MQDDTYIQFKGEEAYLLVRQKDACYNKDIPIETRVKIFMDLKNRFNGVCACLENETLIDFLPSSEFGEDGHHMLVHIDSDRCPHLPFETTDDYVEDCFDFDYWKQRGVL